jgi:hypothetical protein
MRSSTSVTGETSQARQPEVSQIVAEQLATGREAGATVHQAAMTGRPETLEARGSVSDSCHRGHRSPWRDIQPPTYSTDG